MQKRLEKIADNNITRSASKNSAIARLNGLWALFERNDTVLIIINADPDAIASAMALKRLLSYRVQGVTIGYPNEIRRLNNLTMVERLKIPIERLHTLSTKDYTKKILLDSQPNHLACFEKMTFNAVIDHHPVTTGWDAAFIDIRPEYGAVSSIMVEYLRAAGIKPSVSLATALFYGIKVDTQNFQKQNMQVADGICFRYLFNIANLNLVRKFELTELRRSELRYFRTALNEVKASNHRAYVHLGKVGTPDILVIIADFFNRVEGFDWVIVSGIHGEKLVVIFRCDGYRKNAGKLAKATFGRFGPAGGHREAARAESPLKNLPLRENQEFTTKTLIRLVTLHVK
ncbi:MAG: DHH family phosphoesterase [Desulfobulbus sp.]|jgi:nanoRNase/pAp phosphatase (c-di-AMP/oligoRNAs hydrolase)|uniref:DHH family phosphoesterase n=1 Tax=Desulfobulbus sp. TaxID=895 RepID=UPI00284CE22F|nr:DHH family phosphoesterase [Desulfobulbus sp.]MDR2548991.1 DHH family phosphoesterase [Desulfobulbus sp.]